MISILFYIYLALVAIWLLFSVIVFIFSVKHHPLSATNWMVIILYAIISIQVFTVTFSALGRYIPLKNIIPL